MIQGIIVAVSIIYIQRPVAAKLLLPLLQNFLKFHKVAIRVVVTDDGIAASAASEREQNMESFSA